MTNYVEIAGKRHRYHFVYGRDAIAVWLDGRTYYLPLARPQISTHHASGSTGGEVAALMPGKLLRLEVAVGDIVTEKQPVAIMESMKMESTLYSPKAGRVAEIRSQPGQTLEMGQIVVVIE
jgi:biotin carboxyl carrier protein